MDEATRAIQSLPWILAQIIALLSVLSMFAGMCWWVFVTFARHSEVAKQFEEHEKHTHEKFRDVREDLAALSARVDKTDEGARQLALSVAEFKTSAEANTKATEKLTERIDALFGLIGNKPGPSDSQVKRLLMNAAKGDGKA